MFSAVWVTDGRGYAGKSLLSPERYNFLTNITSLSTLVVSQKWWENYGEHEVPKHRNLVVLSHKPKFTITDEDKQDKKAFFTNVTVKHSVKDVIKYVRDEVSSLPVFVEGTQEHLIKFKDYYSNLYVATSINDIKTDEEELMSLEGFKKYHSVDNIDYILDYYQRPINLEEEMSCI